MHRWIGGLDRSCCSRHLFGCHIVHNISSIKNEIVGIQESRAQYHEAHAADTSSNVIHCHVLDRPVACCCPEHSNICLEHYEHLGAGVVDSVYDHWRGIDACHDLLHYANVLGASAIRDDACDVLVLVCMRSSMQGTVMWKGAEEVAVVP